jgi:formylglycine-generating enzyme required for sulfatase activity
MPAIFISHSSRDNAVASDIRSWLAKLEFEQVFLDFDDDTGIVIGEDWEKRLYTEIARCHAVILVLTPNWLASKWCFAELTQARALGKVLLPLICEPLGEHKVLPQVQAADLIDWRNAQGLARIEQRLNAITDELARGFPLPANRPPYPGIHAFEMDDAAIFFGRDDETRSVIEKLEARRVQGGTPMILIIGASGAGKSSLLKAGVLPQLARQKRSWIVLPTFRPERTPLLGLAKAIAQHLGTPAAFQDWHRKLLDAGVMNELAAMARDLRIGEATAATVLLPIDQFEELFTLAEASERTPFLALLTAALDPQRALPLMVLATGRADVLQGLLEKSALAGLIETTTLAQMPLERIPRLVAGPANVAGLAVEEGLAERIKADVENPEALPLLAYTLALLYDRCKDDKQLRLAAYLALGDARAGLNPVQNSVRRAADEAIAGLAPKADAQELAALRDAFVPHLVRVRLDDNKLVRQPARRVDLPGKAQRLLDALIKARLLTAHSEDEDAAEASGASVVAATPQRRGGLRATFKQWLERLVLTFPAARKSQEREGAGAGIIEVVHEALFDAWPTLKRWLDEEQEFLAALARIENAHAAWKTAAQPEKPQALLQGLLLNQARRFLATHPRRFAAASMDSLRAFIIRSRNAARRRAMRMRALVAVVVLLGAGVPLAWWNELWLREHAYWALNVRDQVLTPQREQALTAGTEFKECTDCPQMVVIPAGTFLMGSPDGQGDKDEHPEHAVTIKAFAAAKLELTFDQWDACVRNGDCDAITNTRGWGRGPQPVINVGWDDAQRYVAWLRRLTAQDYRLLTEAQWEYAARAGSTGAYPFRASAKLEDFGWFAANSGYRAQPVGGKAANAFGLNDTLGNVWEWVEDCYNDGYRGAPSDGSAWTSGNCARRVMRGGSWLSRPEALRPASRFWRTHDDKHDDAGFRVARTLAR